MRMLVTFTLGFMILPLSKHFNTSSLDSIYNEMEPYRLTILVKTVKIVTFAQTVLALGNSLWLVGEPWLSVNSRTNKQINK